MPHWHNDEHAEIAELRRIADALERIADNTQPPPRSVSLMALPTGPVAPGASDTYTATALDASGNVVTNAVVSTTSSDDAVVSVSSNGSNAGVETGTWTAVADGSATLTATSEGVSTGSDNPATVTVATPVTVASVSLA